MSDSLVCAATTSSSPPLGTPTSYCQIQFHHIPRWALPAGRSGGTGPRPTTLPSGSWPGGSLMQVELGPGAEIAGYLIERVIGRGGMGVVYLAEQRSLSRRVALKVVAPELAADEGFRARFVREAQLAASLEHPNIIPIHDTGEVGDVLFISMRYVPGTDLNARLEQDVPLPSEETVSIMRQAGSALDAAHAAGLVHRDVKPAK